MNKKILFFGLMVLGIGQGVLAMDVEKKTSPIKKYYWEMDHNEILSCEQELLKNIKSQEKLEKDKKQETNSNVITIGEDSITLVDACIKSDLESVKRLLKNKDVDVNMTDGRGRTPLLIACINSNKEMIQELLGHKDIEVNKADKNDHNPIFAASFNGDLEIVKMLVEKGAMVCCEDISEARKNSEDVRVVEYLKEAMKKQQEQQEQDRQVVRKKQIEKEIEKKEKEQREKQEVSKRFLEWVHEHEAKEKIAREKILREKQEKLEKEIIGAFSPDEVEDYMSVKKMKYRNLEPNDIKKLVLLKKKLKLSNDDFIILVELSSLQNGFFDKLSSVSVVGFINRYKGIKSQLEKQLGGMSDKYEKACFRLKNLMPLTRKLYFVDIKILKDKFLQKFAYREMFECRKKYKGEYEGLSVM